MYCPPAGGPPTCRLYGKAKALMDPFAYETYRQQRIAKKVEDERGSRIGLVRKLPKVGWPARQGRPGQEPDGLQTYSLQSPLCASQLPVATVRCCCLLY